MSAAAADGARKVLALSGPNLNLLGQREPVVYGTATLDEHVGRLRACLASESVELDHLQTNDEATMVQAVHAARERVHAIVINPGAFTHSSFAIADALAAYDGVKIELHLSNPAAREEWRRLSVVAPVVTGTIAGFGRAGYRMAVDAAIGCLG